MKINLRGQGNKNKLTKDEILRLATDYNLLSMNKCDREYTILQLCEKYHITKPTLYKYLRMIEEK